MNRKAYRILLLAAILCMAGGIFLKKNSAAYEIVNGNLKEAAATEAKEATETQGTKETKAFETEKDWIRWVDFSVSYEALCAASEADIRLHETETPVDWIDLLAVTAAKSGGSFGKKETAAINELAKLLEEGRTTIEKESRGLKYYDYYKEAYSAVLSEYIGEYQFEEKDGSGNVGQVKGYGLKAFSPIAKGFPYQDYDDFGVSRSYGYKRRHLGHDMMGQIGTPIIAVESGTVECLGWNRYGGWRIGIRSFDKKRYYYYAHLRQNYPYAEGLKEGDKVFAGQVIGYLGHTGYSTRENVNNIDEPHLHFGIQLIFDESQKEGNHEIWIDCYALVRFLYQNQSRVVKVEGTREWISSYTRSSVPEQSEEIERKDCIFRW
ncbi:MAG: M23 family metallopeptidase [Lachnospiraceae bacterium]|nr:M23 family metallopeptidase [Lachnospiraceae bacterium]